jgi:hypothetical protein
MKKAIIALAILVPTIASAGWFSSSNTPDTNNQNTMAREAAITEVQQRKHLDSTPVPVLETSQERKNLTRRLERFNAEDKVSYIYLVSYGKVMAFYTVKGKVSSVNSMLTTTEQLVDWRGRQCSSRDASPTCYTVPSPDLDGSYGSNGDAIFFFTTEDVYVEWKGEYMLADQPLKLTTQPELVRQIQ